MSRKYEKLAGEIVKSVGGKENVMDVYHCQTRLRFKLADEGKADDKALEATDGKAGLSGRQLLRHRHGERQQK